MAYKTAQPHVINDGMGSIEVDYYDTTGMYNPDIIQRKRVLHIMHTSAYCIHPDFPNHEIAYTYVRTNIWVRKKGTLYYIEPVCFMDGEERLLTGYNLRVGTKFKRLVPDKAFIQEIIELTRQQLIERAQNGE